MKSVFFFFLLLMGVGAVQAQSSTQSVTIQTSAKCGECKERILKAMSYTKGVKSAKMDMETKQVSVVYNPKRTNADLIRKAITMAGYSADAVPANEKAHDALPHCCQRTATPHEK